MIELLFAGTWGFIWQFGLGGALIAGALAGAWFLPMFRRDFLWAAAIVVFALVFESIGIHTEKVRRDAQEQVIEKRVDDAVKNSEDAVNQGKKDPFDDPRL